FIRHSGRAGRLARESRNLNVDEEPVARNKDGDDGVLVRLVCATAARSPIQVLRAASGITENGGTQ
ncbi:hypothetical protein, partial [Oceanithermus sp.]|uniref:hypothetical protein n=1 Tax=Oceanithermus sp. TaxID=2268145 RepID=UPI00257D49E2